MEETNNRQAANATFTQDTGNSLTASVPIIHIFILLLI